MGNFPKPLDGVYELLLPHQERYGSGEDHRDLRRLGPNFLQGKGQEIQEISSRDRVFREGAKERTVNDPTFGEKRNCF